MIFLMRYSRHEGRIVELTRFEDRERENAANSRLEIELELLRKGIKDEVVVLEAESEEALRRTHRRYFETARQIGSVEITPHTGTLKITGGGPLRETR